MNVSGVVEAMWAWSELVRQNNIMCVKGLIMTKKKLKIYKVPDRR